MVAASRRHFSRNPFIPPAPISGSRQHISDFIDRHARATNDAYLDEENRYYKMIQRTMDSAEDAPNNIFQLRRSYVREKKGGLCPTLTANMGIGGHNVPFVRDRWGIRRLSVAEVAQFQGFGQVTDLFPDIPIAEQYRLLGNAVCVRMASILLRQCLGYLGECREKER